MLEYTQLQAIYSVCTGLPWTNLTLVTTCATPGIMCNAGGSSVNVLYLSVLSLNERITNDT